MAYIDSQLLRLNVELHERWQRRVVVKNQHIMKNGAIIDCCGNFASDNLRCGTKWYAPVLSRPWPVKGSAAVVFGCEYSYPPEWKYLIIFSVNSHRFAIGANFDLFPMLVEVTIYVPAIYIILRDLISR